MPRRAPLLLAALLLAGCATQPAAPSGMAPGMPSGMVMSTPEPAGPNPSESAKQVCAADAQQEIDLSLALRLTAPVTPTWADHVYSCRYTYAVGSFTLAVKELADQQTTDTYFRSLDTRATNLSGLGQAAFAEPDGIVVVRKDFKVLRVDASSLPAAFGQPPITRDDAARRIASDIMACWNGY